MVMKFTQLHQSLASDPVLSRAYTLENRYNLATDGMKVGGFENVDRYLTPPQQVQPPQPDPIAMAEAKAKTDTAQAALITAQATAQKHQSDAQVKFLKEQVTELTAHVKALMSSQSESRKDAETANRIEISQREMALAEKAAPGKETDVVSPQG
jgi:hypothetical protein